MALNFKTLAYFAGGLAIIGAPVALIKSSHYSPRFENREKDKDQAQGWSGAAAYYHMLKADPSTGEINETVRASVEQEVALRMANHSNYKTSVLGLNWSELGPDDVGGRTRAICFDRKNQGVIYAGGVSGGIFKSTNGGSSWTPINDQLNNMIITSMSQDATGNTIYFGTGEEQFGSLPQGDGNSAFRGNGVYKLDVATNNVTYLPSTSSYSLVANLVCHKTDPNTIFIGTFGNGFKISNDAGTTWHNAKLATTSATIMNIGNITDVKLGSDGSYVLYAGSSAGNKLYLSANGDDLVADITPTVVSLSNRKTVEIAIAPSNPNIIYLSCVNGSDLMGAVAQSIDKGTTWTKMTAPLPDPFSSGGNGQGAYDNSISVDPKDPFKIFLGGVAFWSWVGNSAGVGTWTQAAYEFAFNTNLYVHSDKHAIEWDPFNNNSFIIGHDGGMSRTTNNGTSYTTINKGYNVTQAYAIAFERYPSGGFGGIPVGGAMCGNQDNGTTYVSGVFNGSKGSFPVGGGDGNYCDFSHISPSSLFSSIYYGQVDRASTPGFYGGSEFYDVEYNSLNGGPGAPAFASFVTPIRLWETMSDKTSIDSVYFKASAVISLIGSTNGVKKTYLSKSVKTNNSAIFETLNLTLGTGTSSLATVNYSSPSTTLNQTITIGTSTLVVTRRNYVTSVQAISTTVTATSFAGSNDYDSLKITFASAPSLGLNIKTELTQKYLSGSDVKIATNATQGVVFGYNLPANLAAGDSVKVPDIIQSRLAVGINNAVYVVKKPLNFSKTPDWVQVAGSKSKKEDGTLEAFGGTVHTMAWSPNGNDLYVGTDGGVLYRISHLHYLIDSVGDKTSVASVDAKFNGINGSGASSINTPIRCTKIGQGFGVITSISVSPDTTAGGAIVITAGVYSSSPKVYYAANPKALGYMANTSNFTSKMGVGATGLVSGDPVYSSLMEWKDKKRVIVGTEHGVYATADITIPNPIWSKENNSMLPNVPVFALRQQTNNSAACYNSGMIYAGTHGRGMWTCDNYYSQTSVGINEITPKDNTTVSSIKLYPNPAHENVNLSFNIEKSESLTLNIYDLKGGLVMTKYLGKLPEGEQLMQISTQDLISGNYIVSLTSSTAIVGTNRLVVVK